MRKSNEAAKRLIDDLARLTAYSAGEKMNDPEAAKRMTSSAEIEAIENQKTDLNDNDWSEGRTVIVRFSRDNDEDMPSARSNFPDENEYDALAHQFELEINQNSELTGYENGGFSHTTPEVMCVWMTYEVPLEKTLDQFRDLVQSCYDENGMSGEFEIIDAFPKWNIGDLIVNS